MSNSGFDLQKLGSLGNLGGYADSAESRPESWVVCVNRSWSLSPIPNEVTAMWRRNPELFDQRLLTRRSALALSIAALGTRFGASRACGAGSPSAVPCVELQHWYGQQQQSPNRDVRPDAFAQAISKIEAVKGTSLTSAESVANIEAALMQPGNKVEMFLGGGGGGSVDVAKAIEDGKREYSPANEAIVNTEALWRPGQTVYYSYVDSQPNDRCYRAMEQAFGVWAQYCCLQFRKGVNSSGYGDLRISFKEKAGHYSNIGIQSQELRNSKNSSGKFESLNIDPSGAQGEYLNAVCLHELGHGIGLQHEHQNPNQRIDWNKDAVRRRLRSMGWTEEMIVQNVFRVLTEGHYRGTEFDGTSIMMYWFSPEEVYRNSRVPTSPNLRLSETDQRFIREKYNCNTAPPRTQAPADTSDNRFQKKIDEIREIQSRFKRP
jgi:hypothetical protein